MGEATIELRKRRVLEDGDHAPTATGRLTRPARELARRKGHRGTASGRAHPLAAWLPSPERRRLPRSAGAFWVVSGFQGHPALSDGGG
jgi:hypothetical protein